MKLKAVVDSLDSVDEKYRDLYVAFQDGDEERFRLDIDGVDSHPDVTGLKSAHEKTKQRNRQLQTDVAALKAKADLLPEDFDEDLYERAKTEGVGGGGKIKNEDEVRREAAEAARIAAEKKFDKERTGLVTERDGLKTRLENKEKREALDAQLDAAQVTDPAYRKAARALLMQDLTVHYDGDVMEVLAKDDVLGDIPVAEHVKTWAAGEGKAFIGARESAGGGADGNTPGGTPPTSDANPWKGDTFNVTRQMELRRDHPDLARKQMREAGVI